MRTRSPLAHALGAAATLLLGCADQVECVARVTDGARTFEGTARGPAREPRDRANLEREALRDACRGMCADDRACAARCVTDVSAAKLGGQVSCK